jgi:hypothetical protein
MRRCNSRIEEIEELVIPVDLKTYLSDISEGRFGYILGDPWKYSEETLGVVVPILRENAPDRRYITMYEVLKELNMKDTGSISQIELQNRSGMAIFVRAGTIFKGNTQPRAVQHSGVYSNEKEIIDVRCVNASYGINRGTEMEFGDIAPPSVTKNLMARDQSGVWSSVRDYTSGSETERQRRSGSAPYGYVSSEVGSVQTNAIPESLPEGVRKALNYVSECKSRRSDTCCDVHTYTSSDGSKRTRIARAYPSEGVTQVWSGEGLSDKDIDDINRFASTNNIRTHNTTAGANDLLGHLEKIKKSQSILDDMMQKVPLFDNQVGAIIFNAVGIIALETFDSPKSWESIKKEIIEKYGDKIKEKQAKHLFELKPEMILPMLKKFIEELDNFRETTILKDEFSETRVVRSEGIIGEYTLVKGQPIHVLLLKEDNT